MDNEDEGARLTQREENRELIAKHRATVEPRGCPTPGACSAVAEIADLKQRLLPQFQGRAQRAEHERDALLEELIAARSSMQQAYGCLWRYVGASNPMFLQARKVLLARLTKEQQAIGIRYANELFGPTTEHEILHSDCSHDAAPSAKGEPVAWMYEEAGERMFGHPNGYRPTNAVPLYAAPVEEAQASEEIDVLGKYDNEPCGAGITLRRQWWSGGTWLEKGDRVVVLRPRMKGEPVGHGYDRAASLNAGHYVCLCGGACSRPDAKEPSK